MRLIGHLAEEKAVRTFGDYLYVQGIENQLEQENPEGWGIWINDEDKIEEATKLLAAFQLNPADAKYRAEAKVAPERRAEAEKSEANYRKKVSDRHQLFQPMAAYGFGRLTFVLIAISVAVFLLSGLGRNYEAIRSLFITDFTTGIFFGARLPEIRHGQLWRLVTPIFIHFSVLHILFNMLWLRDLGSMIEGRQSVRVLAILVLAIAVCSNLGQFWFAGPVFGGMSGVVYGLLGYVWMRGKFDPASGLYVQPLTVTMMLIWFFACFTPIVPQVANGTHAIGLVMGIAWGYLSSLRYR